ncbi:MAG: phosphate ABC transporter substrate-binding protein PstS [Propionivibrio sp.]
MMKRHLAWLAFAGFLLLPNASSNAAAALSGAGSSAAAPVYVAWARAYGSRGGDAIVYDPVGSGAGMERIRLGQSDFGASDVVASSASLAEDGLVMFPTVITGVVPVINLPAIDAPIKLNGEVLAGIFLGDITHWNAAEIARLNPGASLPDIAIRVICRSDSSGTTYHFSDYLTKQSARWKSRFGVANKHAWPSAFVAVKGSSAVSKVVRETVGAIGYIDYNYVQSDGLTGVQLLNAAGHVVSASTDSFKSAVVMSRWFSHGDFSGTLTGMGGIGSWPITMGTYVAVPKVASDTERTARVLQFFAWAYANGDTLAREARFVPLPDKVQANAFKALSTVVGSRGERIGIDSLRGVFSGWR